MEQVGTREAVRWQEAGFERYVPMASPAMYTRDGTRLAQKEFTQNN
jgi:hypothetical protein